MASLRMSRLSAPTHRIPLRAPSHSIRNQVMINTFQRQLYAPTFVWHGRPCILSSFHPRSLHQRVKRAALASHPKKLIPGPNNAWSSLLLSPRLIKTWTSGFSIPSSMDERSITHCAICGTVLIPQCSTRSRYAPFS
ncbi:hypothetical protein AB1N83_010531 [Pleurotus pulmonarius]